LSVVYQGSQYHKRRASRWGAPALFSDKTACPEDVADEAVDAVFPAAIGAAIDR
jgi:hypothetical protein